MEQKIIFLIIIIFALYVIFTDKGRMFLSTFLGVDITPKKR